jgi:hypothetical protein
MRERADSEALAARRAGDDRVTRAIGCRAAARLTLVERGQGRGTPASRKAAPGPRPGAVRHTTPDGRAHWGCARDDDEALVLFEWLSRTDELTSDFGDLVEDQAEQRALWNLTCLLERVLIEPFQPEYQELVEQARSRFRDED